MVKRERNHSYEDNWRSHTRKEGKPANLLLDVLGSPLGMRKQQVDARRRHVTGKGSRAGQAFRVTPLARPGDDQTRNHPRETRKRPPFCCPFSTKKRFPPSRGSLGRKIAVAGSDWARIRTCAWPGQAARSRNYWQLD